MMAPGEDEAELPGISTDAPLPLPPGLGLKMPKLARLSDEEWRQVESAYGHAFNGYLRAKLFQVLFMCAVANHRATTAIRGRERDKRLKAVHDGLKKVLAALDCPSSRSDDAKNSQTHVLSPNTPGLQLWKTLREAALQQPHRISEFYNEELSLSENFDDEILRLRAVFDLAQAALNDWPKDKGGKPESGDLDCLRSIRRLLECADLPAGYTASDGPDAWGGLTGGLPTIVREFFILRPTVFRSGEQSQFAKLIRQTRAPKHPD